MITGSIYYYYYNETLLYIGSTENIKERIRNHKCNLKKQSKKIYFYAYCFENNILFNDLKINIETTEYNTIEELLEKEGLKQKKLKPICNKYIAGRTAEERYNSKELYDKEYREANKKSLSEKSKEYYKDNCEHIKEQARKYNSENTEKIKEYNKERYEAKKKVRQDKMIEYRLRNSEIVQCECGVSVKKYNLYKHITSKKHLAFINK